MADLRLLLADDHAMVREGLRRVLEAQPAWSIVAEASDGRQAVQQALELRPDVIVLDASMPLLNGIEAARQITRRSASARVLMLTMYSEEAYVVRALQAGVRGYVLKDADSGELIHAVRVLSTGGSYFSPPIAEIVRDQFVRSLTTRGITDRFDTLSEREREVFQLLVEGHTNKSMAEVLGVSPATVETHRGHILEKLDLHSAADVVRYAARRGLVR
jgi:two-component system, NarL family, response regulator NreC